MGNRLDILVLKLFMSITYNVLEVYVKLSNKSIRPGGGSPDNNLIEFMHEYLGFVKSPLSY